MLENLLQLAQHNPVIQFVTGIVIIAVMVLVIIKPELIDLAINVILLLVFAFAIGAVIRFLGWIFISFITKGLL